MKKDGFKWIFWGFLFTLLDIRFGGIDIILPDFIGYILMAIGLGSVSSLHQRFKKAHSLAVVMIVLSLVDFVEVLRVIPHEGAFVHTYNLLFPITSIAAIVDIMMVWYLCSGITELARTMQNQALAATAQTRWALYVFVRAVALVSVGLFFVLPWLVVMTVLPMVVFALVVMCLMMGLMKRASAEIGAGASDDA